VHEILEISFPNKRRKSQAALVGKALDAVRHDN
jgi:hypothetical protein